MKCQGLTPVLKRHRAVLKAVASIKLSRYTPGNKKILDEERKHFLLMFQRQQWVLPAGGGDLNQLHLEHSTIHPPGKGEVQIRVKAIGLNFADVFTGFGLYGPISSGQIQGDFVPGLEFSGIVECIGALDSPRNKGTFIGCEQMQHGGQLVELNDDVWKTADIASDRLKEGDRVCGSMRFGSYATLVNVPAHQCRILPPSWSFSQGAAFPVQTLTMYYALCELGQISTGKTVLLHSASGGCGMQAIQICRKMGVHVIGTVGSASKVGTLLHRFPFLSKEQIIVRNKEVFERQLERSLRFLNVSGIDLVLDAVYEREAFSHGFAAMNAGGRYIIYGAASMTPSSTSMTAWTWLKLAWQWWRRPLVDPLELPGSNKSVMGFNLIHCLNDASLLMKLMEEIEGLELEPPYVTKEFPFEEALRALSIFQSGSTTEKLILTCS